MIIGRAGVSASLLSEIDSALERHELIKVRLDGSGREERKRVTGFICSRLDVHLVQLIGRVMTLFRENPGNAQHE